MDFLFHFSKKLHNFFSGGMHFVVIGELTNSNCLSCGYPPYLISFYSLIQHYHLSYSTHLSTPPFCFASFLCFSTFSHWMCQQATEIHKHEQKFNTKQKSVPLRKISPPILQNDFQIKWCTDLWKATLMWQKVKVKISSPLHYQNKSTLNH